ncbi:ERV/ALR sulfhydryl oxidase domain-containing protein [Podospora didyma]|uniref:Sulfhydryl oxidase n=1 Tax=Podospora didyma TaxID=330526 RepID=A0AAE0NNG7_9PEZI|nr:ERV/ALR sulfhydryl oxidase domain-containing protein [Podospora didyma]
MASESQTNAAAKDDGGAAVGSSSSSEPPKVIPKGVVLGKDGKPCRTCNSGADFAAWTSQAKSSLKAPARKASSISKDCPPDVAALGQSSWTLLHSIAATYPTTPTTTEQSDIKSFMKLFSKLYPCWVCAEDFQHYIQKKEVRAGSRDEFGNWLCEAHNEVNKKLGKATFDCSKWEERWRTGWKDGRCD